MEELVFKENQNSLLRKMLIGAIVSVAVLMVSTFGLTWATAILAKDISTVNGALTSSKTRVKLSTIAEGGGGVNVPLTLAVVAAGDDTDQRPEKQPDGGYSVYEGTVLQELVWEAHDQAISSNAAVRTSWTDDNDVTHSIIINSDSLTTAPVNSAGSIFSDIRVSPYGNAVPALSMDVKVICGDRSDLTCDVYSTFHNLHEMKSSTSRHLMESFPRELFGATEDKIPGGSCGLIDDSSNGREGGKVMKAEALKVKNREAISRIVKEATPISVGSARQFLDAFRDTSEAYASESSEYDLANNNCLHFAVGYLKALGKEMKPHHVWYMAKRLSDKIPNLVDKLLTHPSVIEHGSKVTASSSTDILIQMSWILDIKEKKKSLRNVEG